MDNADYRKQWLEWLKATTDLSFEKYIDPTDLSLNNEPDSKAYNDKNLNSEDSEGEFSFWSEIDVTLAHLYGLNAPKGFFGEYSRWAEKMACIQMKGKGFCDVIDKNVEHYLNFSKNYHQVVGGINSSANEYNLLQWAKKLPHYDISAHCSGHEFNFDVKCHVNPKDKDFKHKLHKLNKNEGIYFMRIFPRMEFRKHGSVGKYESVGYLLYDDLIKLFSLSESFKDRIPGYFFFNGSIADLITYCNKYEYLEIPLIMLKVENGYIPSVEQIEKIRDFIHFSKNNDGKIWIETFERNGKTKKVA